VLRVMSAYFASSLLSPGRVEGIGPWGSDLFATDDVPTTGGSEVRSHDFLPFCVVVFAFEGRAFGQARVGEAIKRVGGRHGVRSRDLIASSSLRLTRWLKLSTCASPGQFYTISRVTRTSLILLAPRISSIHSGNRCGAKGGSECYGCV
jgi:hypothetical protein